MNLPTPEQQILLQVAVKLFCYWWPALFAGTVLLWGDIRQSANKY